MFAFDGNASKFFHKVPIPSDKILNKYRHFTRTVFSFGVEFSILQQDPYDLRQIAGSQPLTQISSKKNVLIIDIRITGDKILLYRTDKRIIHFEECFLYEELDNLMADSDECPYKFEQPTKKYLGIDMVRYFRHEFPLS